jgi:membrane protease YdiL (CAAX protease family)
MEDFMFRGGLYRALKAALGRKFATILGSAVFAMVHFNLLSLLPLYVLSVFLVKSYERFGNISVPIVIHAVFNLNSLIVIALFDL